MKFAAYLTFAAVAVVTTQAGYGGGVQQSTAASNGGDCPTVCTDNYKPVCGSDGKTYSNSCNLNLANCQTQSEVTQVSDGVCPTTSSQPSSTGNSGSSACPDVCPAIYKPVCGSDGNTYSNDCELTVAQCKHDEDVTKVSDGQCPTSSSGSNGEGCPNVCFEIYQPVCGTDGVTYANSCFLDIANCHNPKITLASDKPCATGEGSHKTNDTSVDSSADTSVDSDSSSSSSSSSACPSFCTTEYAPVCGSDGDTYSNECKLEIASCNHPDKHITKASDGACSDGCKTGF